MNLNDKSVNALSLVRAMATALFKRSRDGYLNLTAVNKIPWEEKYDFLYYKIYLEQCIQTPDDKAVSLEEFTQDLKELQKYTAFRGPKKDTEWYNEIILEVCKVLIDQGIKNKNKLNNTLKAILRSETPNKIRKDVERMFAERDGQETLNYEKIEVPDKEELISPVVKSPKEEPTVEPVEINLGGIKFLLSQGSSLNISEATIGNSLSLKNVKTVNIESIKEGKVYNLALTV